jgi:hypothetical protein
MVAGMSDSDRLERLEARQQDLDERVLILEAQLRQPLSTVDLAIAAKLAKERYEARFLKPAPSAPAVLEPYGEDQS